jgi:hypothetical protein
MRCVCAAFTLRLLCNAFALRSIRSALRSLCDAIILRFTHSFFTHFYYLLLIHDSSCYYSHLPIANPLTSFKFQGRPTGEAVHDGGQAEREDFQDD